jgi:hypothetical protein
MNNCRICEKEITQGQSLRSGSLCETHENKAIQYRQEAMKKFPRGNAQGAALFAIVDKIDSYVETKLRGG